MNKNQLLVCYGTDGAAMAREILEASGVVHELSSGMTVALKPNLVVSKPCSSGATTSPAVVEGVVQFLQSSGIKNIVIMESAWAGDSTERAFDVCGYRAVAKKYGVALQDLKTDATKKILAGSHEIEVCKSPLEADYLINLPVLKGHCQTVMTCALKNLKGCIPDREKRRFHNIGLHSPIAALNKIISPDLVLVDALCGDLTFEEGGTPVEMNRVILGFDPVKVDAYGASLMGISPGEVKHLALAEQLGVGSSEISADTVIEINHSNATVNAAAVSRRVQHLAAHIVEKEACSICYGSLVHALHRLDEKGKLRAFNKKIHIGQGYKGISEDGLGVGNCACGFSDFVPGCPPKAQDILRWLENEKN